MLNARDDVCTIKDVVNMQQEIDGKEEKDNTKQETSIRKGLTYIMKIKLELGQEGIGWFKVKLSNGIEQFVFRADKFILYYLGDILDIFGRKNTLITPSEERSLIEDFSKILPYSVVDSNAWSCNDAFDTRAYRIEQAIHDLSRRSWVENLYSEELFVKLPAKAEPEREKRREFYNDQYLRVKRWKEKWVSVMEWVSIIRKAERMECLYQYKKDSISVCTEKDGECFYNTGKSENEMIQRAYKEMKKISSKELCQHGLDLFITGCSKKMQDDEEELADSVTQEDVKTMDECKDECTLLFSSVIFHHLKKDSDEDFEYIIGEAITELEIIKKVLMQDSAANERRKESLYPEVEILGKEGELSKIKEYVKKKVEMEAEEKAKAKEKAEEKAKEKAKGKAKAEKKAKETEEGLQHLSYIRKNLNEMANERVLIIDRYR